GDEVAADAGTVGRNLRRLHPRAGGISVEVVARLYAGVHRCLGDAKVAAFHRFGLSGLAGFLARGDADGERERGSEDEEGRTFHGLGLSTALQRAYLAAKR